MARLVSAYGDIIDYPNTTGALVESGTMVSAQGTVGMAMRDIPNNETGPLRLVGVFEVTKAAGEAWTAGDRLSLTEATQTFSKTGGDVEGCAIAAKPAEFDATEGIARLTPDHAALAVAGKLDQELDPRGLKLNASVGLELLRDTGNQIYSRLGWLAENDGDLVLLATTNGKTVDEVANRSFMIAGQNGSLLASDNVWIGLEQMEQFEVLQVGSAAGQLFYGAEPFALRGVAISPPQYTLVASMLAEQSLTNGTSNTITDLTIVSDYNFPADDSHYELSIFVSERGGLFTNATFVVEAWAGPSGSLTLRGTETVTGVSGGSQVFTTGVFAQPLNIGEVIEVRVTPTSTGIGAADCWADSGTLTLVHQPEWSP